MAVNDWLSTQTIIVLKLYAIGLNYGLKNILYVSTKHCDDEQTYSTQTSLIRI